jgi:hypothetical protein
MNNARLPELRRGVMASSLELQRNGAVGIIYWLGHQVSRSPEWNAS